MQVNYEMTDTFAGEANYSWVKRGKIDVSSETSSVSIVRRVKKVLGMNGVRCRTENYGDEIRLYPYGSCRVIFIT